MKKLVITVVLSSFSLVAYSQSSCEQQREKGKNIANLVTGYFLTLLSPEAGLEVAQDGGWMCNKQIDHSRPTNNSSEIVRQQIENQQRQALQEWERQRLIQQSIPQSVTCYQRLGGRVDCSIQ